MLLKKLQYENKHKQATAAVFGNFMPKAKRVAVKQDTCNAHFNLGNDTAFNHVSTAQAQFGEQISGFDQDLKKETANLKQQAR